MQENPFDKMRKAADGDENVIAEADEQRRKNEELEIGSALPDKKKDNGSKRVWASKHEKSWTAEHEKRQDDFFDGKLGSDKT